MERSIAAEVQEFFRKTRITGAELSRASGVSEMQISLLRRGKRKDCLSETARKLRNGMAEMYEVWRLRVAAMG